MSPGGSSYFTRTQIWGGVTRKFKSGGLHERHVVACDGTRAETRFRLSAKRTSPFKSAGASVQSTAGSRCVRISGSNAGYTMFRGSVRVLATHSIRQFPLHFPSRASPCAITFQKHSTRCRILYSSQLPRTQSLCCCHTTNSINRLVVQWRILNEITY